ncbi:UvrD/REP helicase N-terminal domain-containing protein [Tistlia consotensis]|uniref:UvrD/REP helicase N-terminal domain-containing protein n=1 Tax=Tistlia consotensis USBA 355 TaxID=560819 RepID=A0A1Y6CQF7_9PROT|nr:UvrD-helicase domain-containing protein [Tistlia consotensis]SMF82066.1 UvrD/REP helicase N-terminal domain-containing protein [Tistlia consotensis USBA 355]SNS25343.1 UvrD/REP helicase N-terminal domain-containing protein [Tistlia consotensis]
MLASDEQRAIVDAWRRGDGDIKTVAAAGAGKSSTLVLQAEAVQQPLLVLVFNRQNRLDARGRFPPWVVTRTANGAAFAGLGLRREDVVDRHSPPELAAALGWSARVGLSAGLRAADALEAVARFCRSADDRLDERHAVALLGGAQALADAQELWSRLSERRLPLGHDHYLKLWQMAGAPLTRRFGALGFDEAQDANEVMIEAARLIGLRTCWIGDPWQQIYRWRGAVDALERVDGETFHLTRSWRFGQAVADFANGLLRHAPRPPEKPLRGREDRNSTIGPVTGRHAVVCRTISGLLEEALATDPLPISVVGGVEELQRLAAGALDLKAGRPGRLPTALAGFADWAELEDFAGATDSAELKLLVRLVERHGRALRPLLAGVAARCRPADQAEIELTTAHRAKGREWDQVRLAEDFPAATDLMTPAADPEAEAERGEEINLIYVSASRVRFLLQPNSTALALAAGRPLEGSSPAAAPARAGAAAPKGVRSDREAVRARRRDALETLAKDGPGLAPAVQERTPRRTRATRWLGGSQS